MQTFRCSCSHKPVLFFENSKCMSCGRLTGFSERLKKVVAFDLTDGEGRYICDADENRVYRKCKNFQEYGVCNGMLCEEEFKSSELGLCYSCHFNHSIPDLSIPANIGHWRKLETAKRRTIYTLQRLSLPIPDRRQDPENGLLFHFLADRISDDHFREPIPFQPIIYTGHNAGEITINLSEADDVARHRARLSMNERYRTLLGHFRHEIGHFYWDHLIASNPSKLAIFREAFGDERLDYSKALQAHYDSGANKQWEQHYISAYASAHPWEDWAETWAHYLHMVDTLETAKCFGVYMESPASDEPGTKVDNLNLPQENTISVDGEIATTMSAWIKFTVMFNSLNRSMGLADAYPFVIGKSVRQKLDVVHSIIRNSAI